MPNQTTEPEHKHSLRKRKNGKLPQKEMFQYIWGFWDIANI